MILSKGQALTKNYATQYAILINKMLILAGALTPIPPLPLK